MTPEVKVLISFLICGLSLFMAYIVHEIREKKDSEPSPNPNVRRGRPQWWSKVAKKQQLKLRGKL